MTPTHDSPLLPLARAAFAGRLVPEHELLLPGGNASARGLVLCVHGGSWFMTGREQMREMDAAAARWRARGWAVLNVDYRPLAGCLPDVLAWAEAARRWLGDEAPLGLHGISAGGHLALCVAAERDDVAFCCCEAAPTDPGTLGGTPEADEVASHLPAAFPGTLAERAAVLARAGELTCEVLLSSAVHDRSVPVEQSRRLAAALGERARLVELRPGDTPFAHASVDAGELAVLHAAEDELARRATPRR